MSFNAELEPLGDIYSCMTWSKTCILSKQASSLFVLPDAVLDVESKSESVN